MTTRIDDVEAAHIEANEENHFWHVIYPDAVNALRQDYAIDFAHEMAILEDPQRDPLECRRCGWVHPTGCI